MNGCPRWLAYSLWALATFVGLGCATVWPAQCPVEENVHACKCKLLKLKPSGDGRFGFTCDDATLPIAIKTEKAKCQ